MKNYGDDEKQQKKHILDSDKTRTTYYGVIANKVWEIKIIMIGVLMLK